MFIESVIALMLLSLAVFAVPVRWKWQVAFCVVGLGVLSALYEAVGVFSGGGRIYPEGINIVFGPQYGVTDPLSSFFLIILSLSAVAVLIYAKGYIKPYLGRKSPAQISLHYCGLGVLYLSMLLVVTLRDGFSFLAAVERSSGEIIGFIGPLVETIEGCRHFGIAYILDKERWGLGYATEGARASLAYAF